MASTNTKILVDAIDPIPDVPIFLIDKVIDMPKTHLYHMAGNAIVIQVLEAILKELINTKE